MRKCPIAGCATGAPVERAIRINTSTPLLVYSFGKTVYIFSIIVLTIWLKHRLLPTTKRRFLCSTNEATDELRLTPWAICSVPAVRTLLWQKSETWKRASAAIVSANRTFSVLQLADEKASRF